MVIQILQLSKIKASNWFILIFIECGIAKFASRVVGGQNAEVSITTAVFWLAYLRKSGSYVYHWLNLPLLWSAAGKTKTTPDFSLFFQTQSLYLSIELHERGNELLLLCHN